MQANCATQVWREPDQGIWGGPRQTPALRILQADGLGRAEPGVETGRGPRRTPEQNRLAGHARRHQGRRPRPRPRRPGGPAPALRDRRPGRLSTLLAAIFGFLPHDDERLRASVLAIADELTENSYVALGARRRNRRRTMCGQGGHLPHLLVLACVRAGDHRRGTASPRPDGTPSSNRLAPWSVRRGVRRREPVDTSATFPRRSPPRPDRGRGPDHRRRAAREFS